ncbi:MAG: DUF488 family protein [Deltaproteobacteria bacterium]|nr:DUF488 family protein [Deltaproteobacteria bacterium]
MIRTKCVYDKKEEGDGLRVLVTRHWPRGVRKEKQDIWLRELGPGQGLIKLWKSQAITWAEFKKRYLYEYEAETKKKALNELKGAVKSARGKTVTLLCACMDEKRCHRGILKGMLYRAG